MSFALAALSVLTSGYLTASQEELVGLYCLQVSEESRSLLKLRGDEPPTGRLRLLAGGACVLETKLDRLNRQKRGKFEVHDNHLSFDFGDSIPLDAEVKDHTIQLSGLTFVRLDFSPAGSWTVWRDGKEDRSIRLTFTKDGNFVFKCSGAKSSGRYEMLDDRIVLIYTKIDEDQVEPGTMKKEIRLGADGMSFDIDVYHYCKASS